MTDKISNQSSSTPRYSYQQAPKALYHLAGRAIADFQMIKPHDRILLGLSGGKDSLSLLHILLHFQRHAPIPFDIGVVTVDPQSDAFDPSPLIPYLKTLDVPYYYQSEAILDLADKHMDNDSFCAFCSRMKRGIIYSTARRENYNVIALAQHLDDLAESFIMSAFHGGTLNTMKAHYVVDQGDLRVIRPLVYTREHQTEAFAHNAQLPVIPENCPACFDMPTQRHHFKGILRTEEKNNPHLYQNLLSAMRPLIERNNQSQKD